MKSLQLLETINTVSTKTGNFRYYINGKRVKPDVYEWAKCTAKRKDSYITTHIKGITRHHCIAYDSCDY